MKANSISEMSFVMRPGLPIRRRKNAQKVEDQEVETQNLPAPKVGNGIKAATKIYVKSLEITAQCGVYDHEMGKNRQLIIDIEIAMQAEKLIGDDDLSLTYDYDKLAQIAQDVASEKHYKLIETYAAKVAELILNDGRVVSVKVRVEKPNSVKGAAAAGTEIFCTR